MVTKAGRPCQPPSAASFPQLPHLSPLSSSSTEQPGDTLFFHSCLCSGCVLCELLLSLPATPGLMKCPSSVLPFITALVMLLSVYFCLFSYLPPLLDGERWDWICMSVPLLFITILFSKYGVNG